MTLLIVVEVADAHCIVDDAGMRLLARLVTTQRPTTRLPKPPQLLLPSPQHLHPSHHKEGAAQYVGVP